MGLARVIVVRQDDELGDPCVDERMGVRWLPLAGPSGIGCSHEPQCDQPIDVLLSFGNKDALLAGKRWEPVEDAFDALEIPDIAALPVRPALAKPFWIGAD